MRQKFCSFCGVERLPQARFCAMCGTGFTDEHRPVGVEFANHSWHLGVVLACVCIFLFSATLRVLFVQEVLNQYERLPPEVQGSDRIAFWTPDSMDYVRQAGRLAAGDWLGMGTMLRPPGYPVFIWLLGGSPSNIMIVQALCGCLISVCALLLTYQLLGNLPAAVFAGLLSSISPTGVGVTGLVMADTWFAFLFAVGFVVLVYASRRKTAWWVLVASAIFGLAGLVKPVLMVWPLVCVGLWFCLLRSRNRRVTLTPVLLLVCIPFALFLAWATCNYVRDGAFAVSSAGHSNLRFYWSVRTEEWARAGAQPAGNAIRANREAVSRRFREMQLDAAEGMRVQLTESLTILGRHPAYAMIVFWRNMEENMTDGWDYFHQQLPLTENLREVGQTASGAESALRTHARWPLTIGLLMLLCVPKAWRAAGDDRLLWELLALSIGYLYFTLSSGVMFWGGPRILYPVEFIAVAIACTEILLVTRMVRKLLRFGSSAAVS